MAVTITADELQSLLGVDATTATRLLPVCTALVERYAPAAPGPVQDEAVVRTAAWLHEAPSGGQTSEGIGDISTRYAASSQSALRHSGGMALLSPWKVRRGGAI